jgi:predicted alpha/beta-hydrolase family hydrolase
MPAMNPAPLLHDGPAGGPKLVLAHGAGAPMDSGFMQAMTALLAARGIHVIRFEFAYMAARRSGAGRKPPSRMPQLLEEYRAVLSGLGEGPVFIGGKSMGGRAASMLAAGPDAPGDIAGLVCLGYPFHPPGKPDRLRTGHLDDVRCPALIVQGERDPFGTIDEVAAFALPASFTVHWCPAGNHDLVPPKRSGHTAEGNWQSAADAIAGFIMSVRG